VLNLRETRALAQATETSWGHSSSDRKLTSKLQDDVLELQLMTIVHFAGERALSQQLDAQRDYANDMFKEQLKRIKDEFKESCDRALVAKEIDRSDDLELISATSNSPRKIAYFKAKVLLKVS
jgi:hypothetical protein|tara:strand:+ start:29 stop:397 length:369 start_codon:yes stop_codon:yes gene_type:complete